ncbi:MAG TPA: hypothetical protein VEO73_01355 [Gemmatimonadales bacterium]|nr:hypothetical protein [Gemmatimonadales bacterium]
MRASLLACGLALLVPALAPAQDHGPGVPGGGARLAVRIPF